MGMYCLNMLAIAKRDALASFALELAKDNSVYEDIASKFFEHFLYIANAMNGMGETEISLWDEEDGFYYDALSLPGGEHLLMKVRSIVGLVPLFAVTTLEPEALQMVPGFNRRMQWFIRNRPELKKNVACMETPGIGAKRLLAIALRARYCVRLG